MLPVFILEYAMADEGLGSCKILELALFSVFLSQE